MSKKSKKVVIQMDSIQIIEFMILGIKNRRYQAAAELGEDYLRQYRKSKQKQETEDGSQSKL